MDHCTHPFDHGDMQLVIFPYTHQKRVLSYTLRSTGKRTTVTGALFPLSENNKKSFVDIFYEGRVEHRIFISSTEVYSNYKVSVPRRDLI